MSTIILPVCGPRRLALQQPKFAPDFFNLPDANRPTPEFSLHFHPVPNYPFVSKEKAMLGLKVVLLMSITWLMFSQESATTSNETLKAHAKLYEDLAARGIPYDKKRPTPNGEIDLSIVTINDYASTSNVPIAGQPEPPSAPTDQELARISGDSDAVVIATALSYVSALTPNDAFIYSDWTFRISKIYKNASAAQLTTGGTMTVTRTGGKLVVNGVKLFAKDNIFPDFEANHQYLLYLKALPETGSFHARDGYTFQIDRSRITALEDPKRNSDIARLASSTDAGLFLSSVERQLR